MTSLKTAWKNMRRKAAVSGRWHDNRHTLITEMAESGAGDETIMSIAGHVDRQMLRHYSHIRTEAKRDALQTALDNRRPRASKNAQSLDELKPEQRKLFILLETSDGCGFLAVGKALTRLEEEEAGRAGPSTSFWKER